MKRSLLVLAVIAALGGAGRRAHAQATCEPSDIDTNGWREHLAPTFGLSFLAPPRYQHKIWASRSDEPSDREDYWPVRSVQWTFFIETAPRTALLVPPDTTDYSVCREPWTGRGGLVERFRAGWMSTGPTTGTAPYIIRASWPLSNGRILLFKSDGPDSLPFREMYGVVRSIQFTRPGR